MADSSRPSLLANLLSKFNYAQKFLIISLLFATSIFISTYFMIKAQNFAIRFAEKELAGLEYVRLAVKLLELIPEHKILNYQFLLGEEGLRGEIADLQSEIDATFRSLVAFNKKAQRIFGGEDTSLQNKKMIHLIHPAEIQKKWEALSKQAFTISPDQSNLLHDALSEEIKQLIRYVGDVSNLILDPGIESNYLMEPLINVLPEAQMMIPQIGSTVEKFWLQKDLTDVERNRIIGLVALLRNNSNVVKSDLEREIELAKFSKVILELEYKIKETMQLYLEDVENLLSFVDKHVVANPEKKILLTQFIALRSKSLKNSFLLSNVINQQLESILRLRIGTLKKQQLMNLLMSLVCASLAFILGIFLMREINQPLVRLAEAAKRLSAGELSTRIPVIGHDEVGQVGVAFNQMAESFQELIGQLQWTGIQLTTSTTEIAAAAKQQEATVVEQEATTKQIAVTAKEIATTAKEFAKTMNDVNSTAEQTSSLASSGKAGLNRMESIMRQMVDASQNIASKLAVLNEKAGNITSVITTISKVADQTNLLSLNAAIEAEKAGEHGRSFSVIAREIRHLADQTANATLDIEKMVNEMVSAVSAGVMGVDKFSEEIHTGVNQVGIVSEQLTKIIEQVQQQTLSFETVNQGMQTQSLSAEQIDESIKQLSEAAQQTTESIRQFHNAIEQLNNAAQDMQTAVTKLRR